MANFLTDATFAGAANIAGTLTLDQGSLLNGIINTPASLRINIDSDNNNTGEVFIVGKNQTNIDNNNVLFSVAENGNSTFSGNVLATAGYVQGGSAFISTQTIGGTGYAMFGSNSSSEPIGIGRDGTNLDIAIDTSGNTAFGGSGTFGGEVEATSLDINGAATFDTNVNSAGFIRQKNSNAGSDAYVSKTWESNVGQAEIWRNSSNRTQTGGAAQSFNVYNNQDTNIWSGGTRAVNFNTSQNALFAGTISSGAITSTNAISGLTVTARDNMFVKDGQLYIGSDSSSTQDIYRLVVGSSIFSLQYNASGTYTTRFSIAANGTATLRNLIAGSGANIAMDGSSNGQVRIDGAGYSGAIALDATAMRIYHNSSSRDLVFGTNETARLTIGGGGNIQIANSLGITGNLTVTGGDIVLSGTGRIQGIDTVSAGTDAASKDYIDNSIGRGTLSMTTSTGLDGSASFSANSSSNQTFAVTMDLNELNDVDGDADIIDFFVAVDESDDSVRIGRDDMKNVDAHWKHTPFVLNSNFLEQTNTSSYINVPFNNTNDSTSSEYYNFFGCPYPGRVKSMTLMHVDGNMSSGFTTQLRVKKNGATAYTSGELTPSNGTNDGSYVQQDDIHTSFVKGDRLQFALGKSISSRYWQGATMTIVLEFLQYNS